MGQVVLSLPSDGTTIDASDVNTPLNTLVNEFNGNIDDNNIKTGANISGAKLNDASIPGKKFDSTTYGGWVAGVLPAVSSVTCNGNRSYDVVFNSTVASYLTPGMRIRTTRTAAAPTGSITLNGTSQYLSKSSPTGMAATDKISVVGWIKPTAYQTGGIASRNNGSTDGWACFLNSAGQLSIQGVRATDDSALSYQSIPLNKWTHIAATIDTSGAASTMYIDGVSVPVIYTNNANSAFAAPTQSFLIGATNGASPTNFFKGQMAQVAVFSGTVLSQANVLALMSQTLSGSETNVISAYKLDQASGLTDLNTGNANNLTAQGSPTYSTASPFTTDANGTPGGSYDYAVVRNVSTTTATVQVPEGCAIPTSGGVSAVDLSTAENPFGMPAVGNVLGYSIICSDFNTTSASNTAILGLSTTVYVPAGRKVRVTAFSYGAANSNAGAYAIAGLYRGAVGGTQISASFNLNPTATREINALMSAIDVPGSGSVTYNAALSNGSVGTASWRASATAPAYILVELV